MDAAVVERFELYVQALVDGRVNDAEVMTIASPKTGEAGNRRALAAMSRSFRERNLAPAVIDAKASDDCALVLIAVKNPQTQKPLLRGFYVMRQQDEWKMLGYNISAFAEMLSNEQRKRFIALSDWANTRADSFSPGD
ncbi:MAG: hypothetical protein QM770_10665 [Tepidisphaeraceae bacterium]